jgi:molecular chaperone HtpG
MSEVHAFQADISELLNLIINAFYSSKDVFLRELISNSSDSLDKRKHSDLTEKIVDGEYKIRISTDKEAKTLTIEDTGIGMSKEDLVNHLSTIAKSGTKEFVKQLTEKSDQIGQFGVGFYSSFLVADRVDVYTRKGDGPAYKWSSTAHQTYSIDEVEDIGLDHGARIVLHIKEDSVDYLNPPTLRNIVSTHSSFIMYPIELLVEKEYDEPVEETEEVDEAEDGKVEEVEVDTEADAAAAEEKKPKTRKVIKNEWENVTGQQPLWYKKPTEPTSLEYENLYKIVTKDYQDPLYWRHFSTEGAFEFRGILYIPSHTPYNFMTDFSRDKRNIKLYVRKVLVLQQLDKDIMPDWMNFVSGVIDSADMPLNVSREMLQQTKVLNAMKSQIKKQVMNMLNALVEDSTKYLKFYENFSRNLKLGIHEGDDSLLPFLRLRCNTNENIISLDDYISSYMKEDQKTLYYVTGEEGDKSVMTKVYRDRGYSVLFFNEPIDEFMLQRTTRYKEHDMVNIARDHKAPWDTEEEDSKKVENAEFCKWFQAVIDDSNVEAVRISKSLTQATDSACTIMSSRFGWTGNMEKLMMAQPLGDAKNSSYMKGKKIVELNGGNSIVQKLVGSFTEDAEATRSLAKVLYQSSLVSSGFPLTNPVEFSKMLQSVLV